MFPFLFVSLVGFVWFSFDCCFHLSSFLVFLFFVFLSVVFVRFPLRLLFWFQIMTQEKGVFPAVLVFFFWGGGVVVKPIWARMFS